MNDREAMQVGRTLGKIIQGIVILCVASVIVSLSLELTINAWRNILK
jgi:hypothetical protein